MGRFSLAELPPALAEHVPAQARLTYPPPGYDVRRCVRRARGRRRRRQALRSSRLLGLAAPRATRAARARRNRAADTAVHRLRRSRRSRRARRLAHHLAARGVAAARRRNRRVTVVARNAVSTTRRALAAAAFDARSAAAARRRHMALAAARAGTQEPTLVRRHGRGSRRARAIAARGGARNSDPWRHGARQRARRRAGRAAPHRLGGRRIRRPAPRRCARAGHQARARAVRGSARRLLRGLWRGRRSTSKHASGSCASTTISDGRDALSASCGLGSRDALRLRAVRHRAGSWPSSRATASAGGSSTAGGFASRILRRLAWSWRRRGSASRAR